MSLELTTTVDEASVSVPVAWFDPAKEVTFAAGDALVVTGTVRRRFFRSAGVTQSRTEVVATEVVPAGRLRQVTSAVARAMARAGSAFARATLSIDAQMSATTAVYRELLGSAP